MDVVDLHRRAVDYFAAQVRAVSDEQWAKASTCGSWTVRELVNHVAGEDLWTAPLLEGRTIADVGDVYDGDVLGSDAVTSFDAAARAATAATAVPGAMERTVHLSFGDFPGHEYAMQLFADHLVHGWDLATSVGGDDKLDPELVAACAEWFRDREELYRGAGAIGPRAGVPHDADPQTQLLAAFGRVC